MRFAAIGGVWATFFGWPSGGIWSNILASVLWTAPMWLLLLWRQRVHLRNEFERMHDHLESAHVKIDALHEHLGVGR